MPKAEGGCGADSLPSPYLVARDRGPPLSLRDISPRRAGGEGIRLVESLPSGSLTQGGYWSMYRMIRSTASVCLASDAGSMQRS